MVAAGIGGGPGRAVPGCVPQHLEAALAGPDLGGLGDRRDGDPPPVDLQLDLGGALAGAGGGVGVQPARVVDGRALAEGGDLGHVDHLAQVELAAAGLDAQVAVDREVAQRVRRRDGGPADEQGGQGDQRDEGAPHGASLASSRRATGAQRTEKAGLSSRACDSRARADAGSPAQAAAMPAWKSISASWVPRRRLRVA